MMEKIRTVENVVAGWYKNAPHLPEKSRAWLAMHAWWIVLIGAILSAGGIFVAVAATFLVGLLFASFGGLGGIIIAGVIVLLVMLALAFSVGVLVLSIMAVAPLKAMQRRGWMLVFIILLVQTASQVVSFLLDFRLGETPMHVVDLLWGLFFIAIAGYFLFEIRRYFEGSKPARRGHDTKMHD